MFPISKLFGFSYGTFFLIQELFEAWFKNSSLVLCTRYTLPNVTESV
jgi:hypothetical protein